MCRFVCVWLFAFTHVLTRQVLCDVEADDLPASLPPLVRRGLARALAAGKRGRLSAGPLIMLCVVYPCVYFHVSVCVCVCV